MKIMMTLARGVLLAALLSGSALAQTTPAPTGYGGLVKQVAPTIDNPVLLGAVNSDTKAHVGLGTGLPVVSSCGTGSPSVAGTDSAGTITIGTTATACTLTFKTAFTTAPHCVVSDRTLISDVTSYTVGTTTIVLTMTSNSGNLIDYVCIGN